MTQITLNNPAPNQNRPVIEDNASKKGVRKAQALKANLAKRKQQQRARSTSATSAMPGQ